MHFGEILGDLFAATATATATGKPQPQVAPVLGTVSQNGWEEPDSSTSSSTVNNSTAKDQPESGTNDLDEFTEFLERQTATVTSINTANNMTIMSNMGCNQMSKQSSHKR